MEASPPSGSDATMTCPMCAEEVKAAAVICRFCGHKFDVEKPPAESKPTGPPPESLTEQLRDGEELFVWADCYLWGGSGRVAITTDRLLWVNLDGRAEDHPLWTVNRKVKVTEHVVLLEFGDGLWSLNQMHPELAKEIGATIAPGLIDRLFDGEPELQQELRERQERIAKRLPALAVKRGWRRARH
jgi:hypothetical protein